MFQYASGFNQDLGDWDMTSATSLVRIFNGASAFNNAATNTLNNWDISNVTSLEMSFSGADAFNQDISSWNTSSVNSLVCIFRSRFI